MTDARATDEADDEARTEGLIDPIALGAWMDGRGLPAPGEPITSRFISGGASNEIFEIRRGDHRWALRRPPGGAQGPQRDDAARVPDHRSADRHRRAPLPGLGGL
ncbi:MAG: hypothetical protein R2695_08245 [Acidimicrobiales bacterium]